MPPAKGEGQRYDPRRRYFQIGFQIGTEKKRQWSAFLEKGPIIGVPDDLSLVMNAIREFLRPITQAFEANQPFESKWSPGGPWKKD